MKRMISHRFLWALFFTGALVFTSCQENEDDGILPSVDMHPSMENLNVISPEGGMLSFLDGNVILSVPKGAVDFTVLLTVNACQRTGDCPYLLAPVSIEPFVTFRKPVELSIRFSGCLCNGNAFDCMQTFVNACNWQNSRDFLEQIQGQSCNAVLNEKTGSIDLIIYQTGVFAVLGK